MEQNTQYIFRGRKIDANYIMEARRAFTFDRKTNIEKLARYISKNGSDGLLCYEAMHKSFIYWVVFQKMEMNKWQGTLFVPNDTERSVLDEASDAQVMKIGQTITQNKPDLMEEIKRVFRSSQTVL